jgi:polyhydroxybutyrate depolymerase
VVVAAWLAGCGGEDDPVASSVPAGVTSTAGTNTTGTNTTGTNTTETSVAGTNTTGTDMTTAGATVPGESSAGGAPDLLAGTAAAVTPIGRVVDGTLQTPDGRTRRHRLYVPASLPEGAPVPLLVALHAGLGSAAQFAANSGFDGLAEANGFVVVYPEGIGAGADERGLQTWNGGYCCGPAMNAAVDDVGYVRELIDAVSADVPVDGGRVFAVGHSNGGILAYRLACELSDRIVAIGVQAASVGVDDCRPVRPVSVIHLHGTADANHPIEGGVGSGLSGTDFRPVRDGLVTLAAANGCDPLPVTTVDPSNPDVTVVDWAACGGGAAAVRFVVVEGASHAWMGHPPASPAAEALVGPPYPDLDASRVIWSFLAGHPRS